MISTFIFGDIPSLNFTNKMHLLPLNRSFCTAIALIVGFSLVYDLAVYFNFEKCTLTFLFVLLPVARRFILRKKGMFSTEEVLQTTDTSVILELSLTVDTSNRLPIH